MDNRTVGQLIKLARSMPKEIRDNLQMAGKRDPLDEELRERTIHNLKRIDDPLKRRELEKYLADSAPLPAMEANPKAEKEANLWWQAKIEREIKSGRMKRPDPDDPFLRRIKMRMKK